MKTWTATATAEATTALLNAGALEHTLNRLALEARESALWAELPAT